MKQQHRVVVNTITNEVIMKSMHYCEKCDEEVNIMDNFCRACGEDLRKEIIMVKSNEIVIYPPVDYKKVPKFLIDKMDFVMQQGKVIKARGLELLHQTPNFVEDLKGLCKDYGFNEPKTIMFGIWDEKIF